MDLGTYIGQKVRDAIDGVLNDNADQITAWFKDAGGNVNVNTGGATGTLSELLSSAVVVALLGGADLGLAPEAIGAVEGAAGGQGIGFGLGYLAASVGFQIVQPAFAGAQYAVHALAGDGRIDAATAARMMAKHIMTDAQGFAEALDQGFDPRRTAQLALDAVIYPDTGSLFELWRRQVITDTDVAFVLERQGMDPLHAAFMMALKEVLLSPADLALANLRGFMDQPTAFAYAARLGISSTDFQTLIDNTGEPPGLEALLSMYRRGIIDKPTLEHGVRESRVRDEWIGAIEAYRFEPMSTADAIRARVENYMDDATAQDIAEKNGLEPDHYHYLVEAFGRPLAPGQMASLYHRGLATEAEYKQAIRESDIKDKYVDHAFELVRTLLPERQVTMAIEFGALTHDEAIDYLMLLGYTQKDAEIAFTLGHQQAHHIQKDLTASNVMALFTDKLMSRDDATAALVRVGYKADIAGALLDLAHFNKEASLAKIAQTEIKALYQKADIGRSTALERLVQGGTSKEDATALLDEWDLASRPPTRHLTEAQIVKATSGQLISLESGFNKLRALGYSENDATILFQIAGLISGPPGGGGPGGPSGDGSGDGPGGRPGIP